MDYEVFKAIYCAALIIVGLVCLAVITAINPFITLGAFIAFLVLGGAYIVRREGWLSILKRETT